MISSAAMPATGEPRNAAGGVAAGLRGLQADGLEALPDRRDVLDADPVVLDVLPVGDVGGVAGEVGGDRAEDAQLLGAEQGAVDADAQHEVLVVELLRLQRAGLAAVEPGLALRVEAPPAEPAAQVAAVDGGEAALGVDVLDPRPHVERVVVLLGLLVRVQRLAVAERPLALAALGTGATGAAGAGGGSGLGGVLSRGGHGSRFLGRRGEDARIAGDPPDTVVEVHGRRPRARLTEGQRAVRRCQDIHIMLRVRPRSTWRRATRYVVVAALIMGVSLRVRTSSPQTRISCSETRVHDLVHAPACSASSGPAH